MSVNGLDEVQKYFGKHSDAHSNSTRFLSVMIFRVNSHTKMRKQIWSICEWFVCKTPCYIIHKWVKFSCGHLLRNCSYSLYFLSSQQSLLNDRTDIGSLTPTVHNVEMEMIIEDRY